MLSGGFSLFDIPGVSSVMNSLAAQRDKFLAVPARVRLALDKLSRLRLYVDQKGRGDQTFVDAATTIQNNLTSLQSHWDQASSQYSQLDQLRQTNSFSISLDTVSIGASLLSAVAYIMSHVDANVNAVDTLAKKYMTPEEYAKLDQGVYGGSSSSSLVTVGLIAGAVYLLLRRRR